MIYYNRRFRSFIKNTAGQGSVRIKDVKFKKYGVLFGENISNEKYEGFYAKIKNFWQKIHRIFNLKIYRTHIHACITRISEHLIYTICYFL